MAILSKGTTFATGSNPTATTLNNLVDNATFATGAVDDSTTQLSGGAIIVKDGGITPAKLSTGGPSWSTTGAVTIGSGTTNGTNLSIKEYTLGSARDWFIRDDAGVNRLRFSRGSSDYTFWDVLKVAASDNVDSQVWESVNTHTWKINGSTIGTINSGGFTVASGKDLVVGNAYQAGAPTATGYIIIKDSTGTAYKIPAVAV